MPRLNVAGTSALLAAIAASFLLPKLLLISGYRRLWIHIPVKEFPDVLREDLLLSFSLFLLFSFLRLYRSPRRVLITALLSTVLLVLLACEVRARQIWLRPVDFGLLQYGWKFRADLRSGLSLFFNFNAGWGSLTFRRFLALLVFVQTLLWCGVFALAWHRRRQPFPHRARQTGRLPVFALLAWVAMVFAVARLGHPYPYQMQRNPLAGLVTQIIAAKPLRGHTDQLARQFDQAPQPFHSSASGPRLLLPDAHPFERLVLIFLESFRWREMESSDADALFPNLRRMGREGLLCKTYVPQPHSSKAYYAILTGRYPYPGIEMKESIATRNESYVRTLRQHLKAPGYSFSSMPYFFENMGGLLDSVGIERRVGLAEGTADARPSSSFGSEDAPLYATAARTLATLSGPFVALMFPLAAHYPYVYPGKPAKEEATHAAYRKSAAEMDRLLGQMVDIFRAKQLDRNTLFVFVGDHGESFNEHGLLAHNSSLFEEEITVPLLFWSSDGRLRHPEVLRGRELDIGPTILDWFGIETDSAPVQGTSLLRYNAKPWLYLSTFFDDLGLGLLQYPDKYLLEPATGRLSHFDLEKDPLEKEPLPVASGGDAVMARILSFQAFTKRSFQK